MSLAGKGKPKSEEHRRHISEGTSGKPKPWNKGEANPNYGNVAQDREREKFLEAAKKRGQPWGEKQKKAHSERMKGPCNAMRGKRHTHFTKARIAAKKKRQYAEGTAHFRKFKISKAERDIAEYLKGREISFEIQHHISGVPFIYDFFLPDQNLLIEYQGDYWHANSSKYPPGTQLKIQGVGLVRVEEIWARDEAKVRKAEEKGYSVAYIWEEDYKKLGFKIVEETLLMYQ